MRGVGVEEAGTRKRSLHRRVEVGVHVRPGVPSGLQRAVGLVAQEGLPSIEAHIHPEAGDTLHEDPFRPIVGGFWTSGLVGREIRIAAQRSRLHHQAGNHVLRIGGVEGPGNDGIAHHLEGGDECTGGLRLVGVVEHPGEEPAPQDVAVLIDTGAGGVERSCVCAAASLQRSEAEHVHLVDLGIKHHHDERCGGRDLRIVVEDRLPTGNGHGGRGITNGDICPETALHFQVEILDELELVYVGESDRGAVRIRPNRLVVGLLDQHGWLHAAAADAQVPLQVSGGKEVARLKDLILHGSQREAGGPLETQGLLLGIEPADAGGEDAEHAGGEDRREHQGDEQLHQREAGLGETGLRCGHSGSPKSLWYQGQSPF